MAISESINKPVEGFFAGAQGKTFGQDMAGRISGRSEAPAKTCPAPACKPFEVPAQKNTPAKVKNTWDDIMRRLQAPFKAEEIEWRVGGTTPDKSKGMALPYVTNRAIQNRLDELFGPFGWKNEFQPWKADSQLCGISVRDPVSGEWVTKWDGADNSNMEAVKGGLSDAMKRCAYQWGIGRYLYDVPSQWVKLDGKKLGETPTLPSWALPKEADQ